MALYKKKRNRNLMGRFPLSYSWATPGADYSAQSVWANRAPTTQDFDNWFIGAIWIDESTYVAGTKDPEVWMLVRKDNHSALWIRFYGGGTGLETITGDTGGAVPPDATDTIFLNSGIVGLSFDGTPGSNLIELNSSAGEPLFQGLRGDNAIEVYPTPAGYIDTIGTAGQIAVDEDPLNNTMVWSLEGPVATSYVTDAGTAIPAVNILNVLGGTLVNTAGAGNTVTINADGEVLSTVTTDAGVATPVANNLNVLAGENTNTSAAGDTVRVHLNRNIRWPNTNAAGTEGILYLGSTCDGTSCSGGTRFLHNYGTNNTFVGSGAGNLTLATGTVYQTVGIGTNALASLTNTAYGNTAVGYNALTSADDSDYHTAVGCSALSTMTGSIGGAYGNTAIGYYACRLLDNATSSCTAVGAFALENCSAGYQNIAIGHSALRKATTTIANIGIGNGAVSQITTTSGYNIGIGLGAFGQIVSGNYNVAIGTSCLGDETVSGTASFDYNVGLGHQAGWRLQSGDYNTLLGYRAGYSFTSTEHSNIAVGANVGANADTNTIRIGVHGAGAAQQNKCFIAGIRGVTTDVADAVAVLIDSAHQLGTVSSSRKYKTNIEDMGDQSSIIFKLRPVTFNFKEHPTVPAWGLIAEEVAEVFPQLAVYDKDTGEPETVKYHDLPVLLLNELQKQKKEVDETRQLLKNMRDRVRILEEQISLLLQKKGDL